MPLPSAANPPPLRPHASTRREARHALLITRFSPQDVKRLTTSMPVTAVPHANSTAQGSAPSSRPCSKDGSTGCWWP